jgi:aminoglycoside phosphotransferase (APT) family kinase protein
LPGSVETLDTEVLGPYLEANVDGFSDLIDIEKFADGQSNPTFRVRARSGVYVLRRQPPGKLLKSAHAVDREYRVLAALANTEVPVARVHHLCEDRDVIGSMFYVMEFCDGRIMWDSAIPEVGKAERSAIYDEMNRVLAALHRVDIDKAGLTDFGKPGSYFERQYDRWSSQYRASELRRIDAMESLMSWLGENLPHDDGRVSLVHGDYRLDNMIFDASEPRVIALLDWELSTLGHPFADVGYQCMQLRMPVRIGSISGLRGKDLDALGIPTEDEYVARYCERMGIDGIENFGFYVAFSFFRLAAIIQGVAKRAIDGNASNKNAAQMGEYVEPMAELALEAIA